jgi:predicted lipoprotein with Yx(FWY)xxD motif
MNWKLAFNAGIAGAALLVGACTASGSTGSYGSSGSNGYPAYGTSASPAANPASAPTVGLRSTTLGQILVDGNGRTLYLFAADKSAMSTCNGDCASVWPPLLIGGSPVAGSGVNQSLLSTTTRTDGSHEVVYNGHPLYYFVSDKQAGDATGQALSSFGADWYVLSAAGTKVDKG